ncbi:MAG: hypothetical protein KDK27_12910, partial [Leptospiraceae bacterium]|nr:hypothetical protein [Leptospiraceae bacterium]
MSVCGSSANAPTARDNTEFPEWNNSAQDAWEKCKQNLRTQIPPAFYDACIAPLQLIAGSNQQSVLNAPDERTLNMVRDRYWSLIQESFQSIPMAGQVSLRSHNAFQQNKKQTIAVALSTGANAGLPESIRPAGESEIRLSNHASNDQFEIICTSTGFQPAPDNISLLRRVFKTGSASLFTGA